MTREMYESLGVTDLKGIAKNRGIKIPARAKKAEIIDLMIAADTQASSAAAAAAAAPAPAAASPKSAAAPAPTATAPAAAEAPTSPSRAEAAQAAPTPAAAETGAEFGTRTETPEANGTGSRRPANGAVRRAPGRPARRKVTTVVRTASAPAAAATPVTPATEQVIEDVSVLEEPAAQTTSTTPAASVPAANTASAAPTGTGQNSSLDDRYARRGLVRPDQPIAHKNDLNKDLDSGEMANGILEVMQDGFGFIRSTNYMPGEDDIYVAPSQIRRFNLKTGDIVTGNIRIKTQNEKFSALLYVKTVNGLDPEVAKRRFNFEDMTPIFPNEKIRLEKAGASVAMRVMDLMCPVGKGQRGMIVSPPKAGKTTLVKEIARSVKYNNPEIHLIILLIDERPEEVTDIKEAIEGPNVEVIYSTFDELPEHHKKVSEMVIERAKRLVEQKRDVMILLDSITRLTRAYNLTEPSSGRTLTGGLDPAALHMPKRFFGAARNMREGGSLTILATALIETGSKMDDVVYEEFKGTGNMEMILNRKLQERRIFPAVDLAASGTRRDDLLLTPDEREAADIIHRAFIGNRAEQATDSILDLFSRTRTNGEFVMMVRKHQWSY